VSTPAFGVGLFGTEPVETIAALAERAESLGFDTVWIGDSHLIWREAYVTLTACALKTRRVRLGTAVTNALSRDPSVTASAFQSLQELTRGRMLLGIGLGDSAVRTMGDRPATLKTLEETIEQIRRLHRGETVPRGGGSLRLLAAAHGVSVPIYIAGSGPRILELAGRVADGVIMLVGVDPRFIEAGVAQIRRGAAAAGKAPDAVRIVLWIPCALGADAVSLALVKSHIARILIRPLPVALDATEQEVARRIKAEYDYYEHMDVQSDHGRLVPDGLVPRFALAGDPARCAEAVRGAAALGIDEIAIIPYVRPGGDRAEVISAFARDVVARVRADGA
jgi:5,10-methylenetetrahydromethanopterin reductase